ncbi:MAG: hypothetical protein ACRD96_02365, partial [Bryobacteraceae bacterium]
MQVAENHHTGWNRARARLDGVRMPALLLLIVAGFFWKLLLTDQYTWLDSPDLANQVAPWFQFQAGEWRQGRFPLWDPYVWGGQPLVGQAQPGAVYPPNWLLFWLPLRNGWIRQSYLHWYFVLIHFQAALFAYWLARDLKRSRAASLLSGLAFALGGFIGSTDWPQMLNGAVWAPLVFLFFLRTAEGLRPVANAALSGAMLGISFLSGHHQIPIFTSLAIGGAWIYFLARDWRRMLRPALVFGVFLLAVSAAQTIPAYEYGKLSVRWVGAATPLGWDHRVPYPVLGNYSLPPPTLLGVVIPGMHGGVNPYAGWVAVCLAALGVAAGWRERTVRIFAAVALGGVLLALGAYSVFHGLIYATVPMVNKARNPGMAMFVFHFGLSVLIAYGADLCSSANLRGAVRALAASGAIIAVAILGFGMARFPVEERLAIAAVAALVLAAVLEALRRGVLTARAATVALTLVLLFELGNSTGFN